MFLLDTNVLSELGRGSSADPRVRAWAATVDPSEFYLSAVTILEVEIGYRRLQPRDEARASFLREWIDTTVLPNFGGRILPIGWQIAQICAPLHVPNKRPQRDALIAATALYHRMTVVTRNVADFASTGVNILNPWE